MTVYSINKQRLLEQANMTQAGTAKPGASSAEAAFSSMLQTNYGRFGSTALPAASTALKDSFDRPAAEPRSRTPERTERRDDHAARKESRAADRAQRHDDTREPRQAERPAAAKPREDARVEDAPRAEEKPVAEQTADAPSAETTQTEQAVATEDAPVTQSTEPQAVAAPVQTQATATQVTGNAELLAADDGAPEQDLFAGLDSDQGDQSSGLENLLGGGDSAEGEALEGADPLLAAQAKTATTDQSQPQVQQQSTVAATAKPAEMAGDLAREQADDMAVMLDGTGANVKVKVAVEDKSAATVATQGETAGGDATNPLDLLLGQEAGGEAPLGGQAGNGASSNGQNGQQNQGLANAAQQVARNGALENAQASSGRAAEAKPFAAALAAQMEASGASQGNSGTGQTQAVAGLSGANAASAAQKSAQAQAAKAPHQPQRPDPKQVIDQISVQISKQTKEGSDTIKVQLKPVDLGRIEIKLDVQDGKVTAHVSADNKETLALLQKDSSGLEKALRDAGLKTDQGSMSFSLSGDGQQAQQNADARGRGTRRSRRLAAGVEGAQGTDATQAAAPRTGGRSGLDIKV